MFHVKHRRSRAGRRSPKRRRGRPGCCTRTGTGCPARPDRRILTVANQKGGVGKTTSTVNLAAALALHGVRVLVIDLDPQGNASTALGVDHQLGTPSVYEALLDEISLAEAAVPSTASPDLLCVPATIDLAGAEIELVSMVAREHRLKQALVPEVLDELDVDYVFVDCPPSLGLLTVNALVAADEVLIPIQCEYYALEGLGQLLSNIDLVRSHLNTELHVSTILLTMYDGRTKLADQVTNEVREPLRADGPAHGDPPQREGVRGAGLQPDRPRLRPGLAWSDELRRRGAGDRRPGRAVARPGGPRRGLAAMNERGVPQRKGGLGRGLAALIPTRPDDGVDVHQCATARPRRSASRPSRGARLRDGSPLAAELREIEIEAIVPNPQQPRTQFDDESLGELEHSIREFGLLQPIVVRETEAGRFQLVMGERRWRAAKRVGLQTGARDRPPDRRRRDAPRRACWRTSTACSSTRSTRRRPTSSSWSSSG